MPPPLERGARMAAIISFVFFIVGSLLNLLIWAIIINALLSWLVAFDVINLRNRFVYNVARFLDAVTGNSRGVPLLWPLSGVRIAAPWRPLPDPPTGLAFVSLRGCEAAIIELIYFLPILLYALWPRSPARHETRSRPTRQTPARHARTGLYRQWR